MSLRDITILQQDALKKMKDTKLLLHVIEEVHKEGVVGEENSIAILVLKMCLRLVKDATPTSSNILVSDSSGGGKDWVVKNICKVLLEKDKTYFHRTDLSKKVLGYWELFDDADEKKENPLSWDGKVIYLEDPIEDVIKCQAFKVRTSGNNHITVVQDGVVVDRELIGKPVFIVTSMGTSINVEGTRRWDCIRLDVGNNLTKAIVDYNFKKSAGLIDYNPDEFFRSHLKRLKRVDVNIPYATDLIKIFPDDMAMRTQVWKLIDYIKASAALHQHSRKTLDGKLQATAEDYEYARLAFTELHNMEGQALNKKEQIFVDYLREKKEPVNPSIIVEELKGYTKWWIRDHKEDLIERMLVAIKMQFNPDANRDTEHLYYDGNVAKKRLPLASELFDKLGYISSRQLYKDVDKERKQQGLKPLFKEE